MLTLSQVEQFRQEGYVIVDDAVAPGLMEPLREAAERVTRRTRAGEWSHRRAAGEDDVWGVQHLLHPELGEPVFAEYMATDAVLEVAAALIGLDLRLGLVNMLVEPAHRDFAIGWHRDLLRREVPAAEEVAELGRMRDIVQWNTALYDDACLVIVPGTHRRAATGAERDAQFRRPMEPLPHQHVVRLSEGQGVYYNNLLIHRGVYPAGRRRATLHAALTPVGTSQYRLVYDALRWMERPGFRETLPARLRPLYDRWLEFAFECRGEEAGPSS